MRNFLWDYSTDLHAIPVTSAGAEKGDWISVGAINGIAIGDADPDTDTVVTQIKGGVREMFLSADAGADIAEGDYLLYDAALDSGNGGFTNTGASVTDYDAIAGLAASVAMGTTGTGRVWLGVIPFKP